MIEQLNVLGQGHLLKHWQSLKPEQKQRLLKQIDSIDPSLFKQLLTSWKKKETNLEKKACNPPLKYSQTGNFQNKALGDKILAEGGVGCLLIAGGQGTRLQFNDPKGQFPVTVFKNKSLFQLFAEKTIAASKQVNRDLPLAIMTSPLNHEQTIQFFQANHLFGLKPEQVYFFQQTSLPLLDNAGNLFLEGLDTIAMGPDGNGSALKCFVDSGIWEIWRNKGIHFVISILVDNPLANPFDAELIGFHLNQNVDVVIKSTKRLNAEEKVGVLVENHEGKIEVIEYSELSHQDQQATLDDGSLKYPLANLSLFSFKMEFIKNTAERFYEQMPYHLAHKAVKFVDTFGSIKQPTSYNAWKFERFIFDVLPFASQTAVLNYPREVCFAPLKNKEGLHSLETVQNALQIQDRLVLQGITGKESPLFPFELSQRFYYPTSDLLDKWKGRCLTLSGYIED